MRLAVAVLATLVFFGPQARAAAGSASLNFTFSVASLLPSTPDPNWPEDGFDPTKWAPGYSFNDPSYHDMWAGTCLYDTTCFSNSGSSPTPGTMFTPRSMTSGSASAAVGPSTSPNQYFATASGYTTDATYSQTSSFVSGGGEWLYLEPYTQLALTVVLDVSAVVGGQSSSGRYEESFADAHFYLCSISGDSVCNAPPLGRDLQLNMTHQSNTALRQSETATIVLSNNSPWSGEYLFAYDTQVVTNGFTPAAPVPEPSSWALLIAGLAFFGCEGRFLRRTRRATGL
jgi:hypothetical protein